MYRRTRSDKQVGKIEKTYNLELNARGDTKLGNLLLRRGFRSQSEMLRAARGQADSLGERRKLFLSFHYEDLRQVQGFRLMAHNPSLQLDFFDRSVREPINSEQGHYIKNVIREKIRRSDVVVCLIGDGTAWRDWVDWELRTAVELGKGVCGVRLKGSRGRAPEFLTGMGCPVARWDTEEIIAVIEKAAALRS